MLAGAESIYTAEVPSQRTWGGGAAAGTCCHLHPAPAYRVNFFSSVLEGAMEVVLSINIRQVRSTAATGGRGQPAETCPLDSPHSPAAPIPKLFCSENFTLEAVTGDIIICPTRVAVPQGLLLCTVRRGGRWYSWLRGKRKGGRGTTGQPGTAKMGDCPLSGEKIGRHEGRAERSSVRGSERKQRTGRHIWQREGRVQGRGAGRPWGYRASAAQCPQPPCRS